MKLYRLPEVSIESHPRGVIGGCDGIGGFGLWSKSGEIIRET